MGFYFDRKKPDDPRILAQLISAYSQFDPEKAKLYPCILCTGTSTYINYIYCTRNWFTKDMSLYNANTVSADKYFFYNVHMYLS